MESKTWIAVALCCLIWFGYMKWFAPPVANPNQPAAAAQPGSVVGVDKTKATATAVAQPTGAVGTGGLFDVSYLPKVTHQASHSLADLSFSTDGGGLVEVDLANYLDQPNKAGKPIQVFKGTGTSLNLVSLFSAPELAEFTAGTYLMDKADGKLLFTRKNSKALVRKTWSWEPDSYFINLVHEFEFNDPTRRDWGVLAIPVGGSNPVYDTNVPLQAWEAVYQQNDSVSRIHADSLQKEAGVKQGATAWLSFGNRYFASIIQSQSELNPDIVVHSQQHFSGAYLRYPLQLKDGQNKLQIATRLYVGPKDYDQLGKVGGLKQVIDYGFFSFFAYPLLELLRFFYKFVHNYGVSIILLTILVRLLFYPLSVKSYKSMKSMQKLQPQIAALKEKYKEDMQRFSQEQMALFKAHKVNPMGGCLPMLVQLPVFIALYAVLGNSIELFHAPFFGWIGDLSAKDPFYIYPVLMGLAMLLQTKLTPAVGADPMQQKMMYLMPVVFTFIMLNLPSGLTLYIFVSTLLGILQQWVMMRESGDKSPAVPSIG